MNRPLVKSDFVIGLLALLLCVLFLIVAHETKPANNYTTIFVYGMASFTFTLISLTLRLVGKDSKSNLFWASVRRLMLIIGVAALLASNISLLFANGIKPLFGFAHPKAVAGVFLLLNMGWWFLLFDMIDGSRPQPAKGGAA